MSIAALERQNPELAAAMKKMQAFGEPKTARAGTADAEPPHAVRAPRLHGGRRRRRAEMPEATNRQLRRRMEHGGAGMPVRAGPLRSAPAPPGARPARTPRRSASPRRARARRRPRRVSVDERPDVVVGRAVVDDARPQADAAVDLRRRDPDAPVLLERAHEPGVVVVEIVDARGDVAEGDDGQCRLAAEQLEVVVPARSPRTAAAPGRGSARSRRGSRRRRGRGTPARASAPGTAASTRA